MNGSTESPPPRPVIAGNWKMHKGPSAARLFLRDFQPRFRPRDDRTVIFFPPAVSLPAALQAAAERPDLQFGVQSIHWEAEGAFTGEIGAAMARDAGARFTLVGHSERRHLFGETDEMVARKAAAALAHELTPVICLGETLDERRSGRVAEVILRQLEAALELVSHDEVARLVLAYEPVWAIGTGETATPQDAVEAHGVLRGRLRERAGDAGDVVPILYGGSVKPGNVADLLAGSDVDGVLVGGASLDPVSFAAIANTGTG